MSRRGPVRGQGAGGHAVQGTKIDDRPPARRIADTRAVAVQVVTAQEPLVLHVLVLRGGVAACAQVQHGADRIVKALVGIDQVREGGREEGDAGLGLCGDDDKGQVILGVGAGQVGRVHAARPVWGHGPLKGGIPLGVFEIVVVEVNGPVLAGGDFEIRLVAGPVVPGHGPGRQVDRVAVELVGLGVAHYFRADIQGKVPASDRGVGVGLRHGERTAVEPRIVDLAIEVVGGHRPRCSAGHQQILLVLSHSQGADGFADPCSGTDHRPVGLQLLIEADCASGRVVAGGDTVPLSWVQGHAGAHFFQPRPSADPQGQRPVLIDKEAIARLAGQLGHQPLQTLLRRGGVNPRPQGKPIGAIQQRVVRHGRIRAAVDGLVPAQVLAADRGCERFDFAAGTLGIGVRMPQAHELGAVRGRFAADHKAYSLPGTHTETVAVPDDFHLFLRDARAVQTPRQSRLGTVRNGLWRARIVERGKCVN